MSMTLFCGDLCNHKVLPKRHLILSNSQWSGIEKLNLCWDMPPRKRWETPLLEVYLGFYTQVQNIKTPIDPKQYLTLSS